MSWAGTVSLKHYFGWLAMADTSFLGFKKVANRATTQVMMKTGRLCISAEVRCGPTTLMDEPRAC